jgi:hypothetical protein
VGWSVAVVATLINDFLHISVEIGSKLEDFSSRRQTAPELHSEFSSGISRTIVQTGVSFSAYWTLCPFLCPFCDFDAKAPVQARCGRLFVIFWRRGCHVLC